MVVMPNALRKLYGIKEESPPVLGSWPSFTDNKMRCLKSKLRVSNTPIICIPMAGSPWKGMLVLESTLTNKRRKVSRCTFKLPSSIKVANLFKVVYARKIDSR